MRTPLNFVYAAGSCSETADINSSVPISNGGIGNSYY